MMKSTRPCVALTAMEWEMILGMLQYGHFFWIFPPRSTEELMLQKQYNTSVKQV